MADRYADVIQIAGITLTGCKGLLIDGEGFSDPLRTTLDFAPDATPNEFSINSNYVGTQFGVSLASDGGANLITTIHNIIYAVRDFTATQGWFPFVWQDAQYLINAKLKRDTSSGPWYQYGRYSAGYLQDVIFRFVVYETVAISLSTEEGD